MCHFVKQNRILYIFRTIISRSTLPNRLFAAELNFKQIVTSKTPFLYKIICQIFVLPPFVNHQISPSSAGVLMKDLIALDTAVEDFVEENGRRLCHFKKISQISQILSTFNNMAHMKPPVSPKADLVNLLRVSVVLNVLA